MINEVCSTHEGGELPQIPGMTLPMFTDFIFYAKQNNCINPDAVALKEDAMHMPLTAYFCNSSHNTYLTGHQLKGESSTGMYE
jgi:hypothetical protein